MSRPMPKMIANAIYRISSAWEKVRFLITADVELE